MNDTGESIGPSTDRNNDPVVDPTKNVLDLVEAERRRQDDLRMMDSKWRDTMDNRERQHAKEMREAEAGRIDAILEAAAANVQRAADVQSGVAERLAQQVTGSAEVVRLALRAEIEPVQKDIQDLRRVQYEGVGQKTQVVESRSTTTTITAVVGSVIALLLVIIAIINFTHTNKTTVQPIIVTPTAQTTTTTPTP
jgi:hypothetical protein